MTARLSGVSADMKEELAQRVRAGAAFLDSKAAEDPSVVPVNWRELIGLTALDLRDPWRCVLGQLSRYTDADLTVYNYPAMADLVDLDALDQEAADLGFLLPPYCDGATYLALTQAWRDYLDACVVAS
jgi:hypothetical protein